MIFFAYRCNDCGDTTWRDTHYRRFVICSSCGSSVYFPKGYKIKPSALVEITETPPPWLPPLTASQRSAQERAKVMYGTPAKRGPYVRGKQPPRLPKAV